jgi:hypothetical protein
VDFVENDNLASPDGGGISMFNIFLPEARTA